MVEISSNPIYAHGLVILTGIINITQLRMVDYPDERSIHLAPNRMHLNGSVRPETDLIWTLCSEACEEHEADQWS